MRPVGSISGFKWHDQNGDGVWDPGEPGLPDWKINLSGDASSFTYTASDGSYIFEDLLEGNYQVTETLEIGWIRTYPASGMHDIYLPPGGTSTNNNFGNVEAPPSIGGDAETLDYIDEGTSYSSIAVIAALAAASILLLKAKD